ncbi:MAG TPA: TorF family putative porin [Croceibacterium sp.]|nr:TorF family putative porin [Croceibacterium sp.]
MAVEAALQSDYRVRGYSISDEEPSASVSLSYDDPSGAYVGASVIGSTYDGDPVLFGIQGSAGYAARVGSALSLDAGISRTQYFYGYGTERNYDYTEVYLGAALPLVSARLSYSPDYYRNDMDTVYFEVETGVSPATDWFLSAHAGVLTYLGDPPPYRPDQTLDWRVGASRQFGPWGIHLDLSGRIEGPARYVLPSGLGSGKNHEAVVVSLTRAF